MNLTAISLFTGVGGLDFGFEAAGFETRVALDVDPIACATIRINRNWSVLEGAIEKIPTSAILSAGSLPIGGADILIGGPPCQPFSKSGYWARGDVRRLNDPRANTLEQFLRVLKDAQPKAFLLENVPGLAFKGKTEGIEALKVGISAINEELGTSYSLSYSSLNAAHFGVPQLRERVFVVGARDGREFQFPAGTFFAPDGAEVEAGRSSYRTAWDAFNGLLSPSNLDELRLTGKWADLLPSVPEGENYLWHTERGGGVPLFGWRRRYWNFLLKLAKHKPSWTIQAQPGPATGPFHWDNRRLSAQEMCRLQTFPDGLRFIGSISDTQRLVGNAVASGLAEVLAREIQVQLFDHKVESKLPSLIPSRNMTPTEPSQPDKVTRKYLYLLNSDTAHPGTGLGRAAASREQSLA
jgi:DNA (cytosine-5)-methyltransferase 1